VKSWLEAHRPAAGIAKGSFGKVPDYTNTTIQQQILSRLDKQGVDTTALKTAFQGGDTAAVNAWFEAFFKARPHAGNGRDAKLQASS
jgi:hypothetical protein